MAIKAHQTAFLLFALFYRRMQLVGNNDQVGGWLPGPVSPLELEGFGRDTPQYPFAGIDGLADILPVFPNHDHLRVNGLMF